MSVSAEIKTVLETVCPRVFPGFAPVKTTRPYVTYRKVGGKITNLIAKEVPPWQNGTYQINVWANSHASAASLMLAIEAAMVQSTTFTSKALSESIEDFDADIPVFSAEQEFYVWSSR